MSERPTPQSAPQPASEPASTLNPTQRSADRARIARTSPAHPLDVLVVGGGVTGAGIAFDSALRGLDTAIVEASDWASGTSAWSSKLVHGGLRYLEMLDFGLVAEALRERDLLLTRTAPHLVRRLSFLFPLTRPVIDRAYIGAGVALYDAIAMRPGRKKAVHPHQHHRRRGMLRRFGGLDRQRFTGAIEYADGQVDDARLTMTLARSARKHGAAALSRMQVVDYLRDGQRVIGARVRDADGVIDVYARCTIIAGGVWTEREQQRAGAQAGLRVSASKGVHITVPADRISAQDLVGLITRTEKSVLFVIPWGEVWIIGTTDTPWRGEPESVAPTSKDIDYLLEHANAVLRAPLHHADVIGVYAGLRPLVQPPPKHKRGSAQESGSASTKISREHTVTEVEPGLTSIAGGKLTTYRVMAQDAVDFAIRDEFRDRACLTESVPLEGAQGFGEMQDRAEQIAADYGLSRSAVDRLLGRYGSLLPDVLALIDAQPELAEPLTGAEHCVSAEVVYAVKAEGALSIPDVLWRRLRLDFEVPDRGLAAAQHVPQLVAAHLGWDAQRSQAELADFADAVSRRLSAEGQPDDTSAAAAMES